jgi:hypothetical protein
MRIETIVTMVAITTVLLLALAVVSERQRPIARMLNEQFLALANDLVPDLRVPPALAWQLVLFPKLPIGEITSVLIYRSVMSAIMGAERVYGRFAELDAQVNRMPVDLRGRFLLSMLSAAVADTYSRPVQGLAWRLAHWQTVQAVMAGDVAWIEAHDRAVVAQAAEAPTAREMQRGRRMVTA